MNPVVTDKPYVPALPYHGTVWPRVLALVGKRYLVRRYGVRAVRFEGVEKLAASIRAGHGVLVTPNHCRDEDPLVIGMLSREVGRPFFAVASAHLFMGSKVTAWLLRRAGAFSIYREGMDKQAVQTSIEILEKAERPLVIFPEGHISRTNDRLTPMLEGTSLIARQAAKRREKTGGKVVIHPVAIRYSFPFDVEKEAAEMLDEIEQRLTWRPSRGLPLHERFHKVGAGLLALKELEFLGRTQDGTIAERLEKLIDAVLKPMEAEWVNGNSEGYAVGRVKRLRTAILPEMIKGELGSQETARRWRQLDDAYLAQQLYHYPPDYVGEHATPARIMETVERFEEDLTGKVRVHGPVEARVTVGDAMEVSAGRERGGEDSVMAGIEQSLRGMLGLKEAP